jgi:hypothetical protein
MDKFVLSGPDQTEIWVSSNRRHRNNRYRILRNRSCS